MKREERNRHWRTLVEKQAEGGLSGAAFCREHHIKLSQFYRWRRRFRCNKPNDIFGGFLELVPCSKSESSGIHIRLGDALWIEVERGFDPFTLRAVIEAIYSGESKPCLV